MRIDYKYSGEVFKNDGTLVPEEEMIVFRAKDKAVPAMLRAYISECIQIGADESHWRTVMKLHDRVIEFQEHNPNIVKIPDTLPNELISGI